MKASSILLIFPHTSFHQATTVPRHSNGAMLSNLLGLLVLSCLCSAMPNSSGAESESEEGSTMDPNTFNVVTSDETSQETSQEGGMSMKGYPMQPSARGGPFGYGNMTYPVNPVPDIPDSEICDMMLNGPVQPPIDQIPFHCLCTHCKGTLGHKGDMGDRGLPGQPGSPGRRGMQGFKGRPGFTGGAGIKGQKGDMGEKGSVGMTGFSGSKGSLGYKGEKGELGMTGPEGAVGPQGDTGTCPASCESDPGPAGPQGAPGPAGGRGLPGLKGTTGTKGLKGDPGTLGTPGTDGPKGPKGDLGEQGICNCTDGADGRNGTKGDKGSLGQKGDTGTDGVTGPEGPMGPFGPMGRPGPCSPAIQSSFSACINASFPPKNMPVVFPHILTNEQGHFDALTGMYMAPVNGTYVFSYHLAVRTKVLTVGLFRNFFPVVKTTEATDRATASQTVVLHLAMGDRLWLQVKNEVTNGMFTDSDSSSTFTGYLLHPDSCEFSFGRDFMPLSMEGDYNWDGPEKTNTHTVPPTTTTPP